MHECSHGLYTLSIEELPSGREIKDERQVRRHPDGRKDKAKKKKALVLQLSIIIIIHLLFN